MYSIEVITKSLSSMDDHQLIQRWKDGLFSNEARPIAESELRNRGIDPADPVARHSETETNVVSKAYKPRLLPSLFAITAGGTAGQELGGALAGAIGAGVLTIILFLAGWYLGGAIARFAHKRKSLAIRILICVASLIAWLYLSGIVVAAARLMRGTVVPQL